jgi:4-amino-4-deoxy-L-arabinose transferase-like glycosyltransferase
MEENTNIEHRTSNIEHRSKKEISSSSMLDVQCSMFDVRLFFQLLFILLTGLFIYGYRLGDSPLDRTEPFRALVAHQMVHGSSWLIPHLYGELYLRKPPLIYWIEAIAEKGFGRGDEFVWRLPSAVGSALLAVFLAWWSGRWFGASARLPAGFACLALVALWEQDRGADIDALNTVFAVIASLCVLELVCGQWRWCFAWTIGLGLSLGATLLLKGPGGLPQVIGATLGPAIFLRNWKIIRKPSIAIGLLIGIAIFAAYVVSAKVAMAHAGIVPDQGGWREIVDKMLHGWLKRLVALAMPISLLVYAIPVSAVLPFAIVMTRRMAVDDVRSVRAMAILGTLAVTVVIWMIEGNDNPRYEYVMLPLLAPLVGFVWTGWDRREIGMDQVMLGICILLCGANAIVVLKLPHAGTNFVVMLAGLGISIILVLGSAVVISHRRLGWWLQPPPVAAEAATPAKQTHFSNPVLSPVLVILLVCFSMTMGERKNAERRKKSAKNPAMILRQLIGDAKIVSAAGLVRDLPELFYYTDVDVHAYGEFGLPKLADSRGGRWVVVSENENQQASAIIKKYITRGFTKLPMPDPHDRIYVGWYDPPGNANTHVDVTVKKSVESED